MSDIYRSKCKRKPNIHAGIRKTPLSASRKIPITKLRDSSNSHAVRTDEARVKKEREEEYELDEK
jgi:hypothetical protein